MATNQTRAALAAAAQRHGEPDQLIDRRLAALAALKTAPQPRMQRFSFQDWPLQVGPLSFQKSKPALAEGMVSPAEPGTIRIVQVGQTTTEVELPEEFWKQGVILTDIFTAARVHPQLLERYLMTQVIKPDEDRLAAAHLAYLNAGALLYVPKGVTIDRPVEVELIQDATTAQPLSTHLLIVAEDDSQVQVLEHLQTAGEAATTVSLMVEIMAKNNSRVTFTTLDEFGRNTTVSFKRRARIERDAQVEWALALMNDGNTVGDVDAELVGTGAAADARAIAVTTGEQHVGINNRVTNRGKQTTGLINQRGVLLGSSHLVFNGIGQIIHGAHGAKADQQNRVLMMSPTAQGDANPILLIDENDVVAGHAASVGPVNPQQMYYLMSRGIPRAQAERLVIRGFLSAVIIAIPSPTVRQKMIALLERKLADGQAN